MPVGSKRRGRSGGGTPLEVRLLGPLTVMRDGKALALSGSRKVRALFGFLALAPHTVTRSQLCELLWDAPVDPRGELRWCLSRLRTIADEPGRTRVVTAGDAVALELGGCAVDAVDIARAAREGLEALDVERLRALHALFRGDLLQGLEIDGNAVFNGWLVAQRRRFRGYHAAVLERLVAATAD